MKLDEIKPIFFLFVLVLYTHTKEKIKILIFGKVPDFRLRVGDFGLADSNEKRRSVTIGRFKRSNQTRLAASSSSRRELYTRINLNPKILIVCKVGN